MPLPKYRISQSGYTGTHEEERAAKQMMLNLLPKARAQYMQRKGNYGVKSTVGHNFHQYKFRRLVGIHIYRSALGFLADAIYKNLPLGLATVLGTPTQNAHESYEQAVDHAVSLIAMALHAEDGSLDPVKDEKLVQFDLDGMRFTYKLDDVADAAMRLDDKSEISRLMLAMLSPSGVHEMLVQMLKTDFGAREMHEIDFQAELSDERLKFYTDMMILGLTRGLFRVRRNDPEEISYQELLRREAADWDKDA